MKMTSRAAALALSLGSLALGPLACSNPGEPPIQFCSDFDPHDAPPECDAVDYGSPQGGEVRFEYLEWPRDCGADGEQGCGPAGIASTTRIVAYAMTAMQPEVGAFPYVGACSSMVDRETWPLFQGEGRQYADMGALAISGGPDEIVVPLAVEGLVDPYGRTHDRFQYLAADNAKESLVTENAIYDLYWAGSSTMPEHDLQLYMPGAFTLLEPGNQSLVQVPKVGDFRITWGREGSDEIPDNIWPGLLGYVAIVIPGVGLSHYCIGRDVGEATIPSQMMEEAAALAGEAGSATLLRGKYTHQLAQLRDERGRTGKRIDLIGSYSYVSELRFLAE